MTLAIVLTGRDLNPDQLVAIADGYARVLVDEDAWRRAEVGWQTARRVATRRPVYGRSTGVGSNRSQEVDTDDATSHGLRLLRSSASGAGPILPEREARAMMAVRANQLLGGASGAHPRVIGTLVDALNAGAYPLIHRYGAIGTGDLTALAETALTMLGERPWAGADVPPLTLETGDALPFLSSNALTIGLATLAYDALARLSDAACVVAAMTFFAAHGSAEPYAAEVHAGRAHAGSVEVARRMRALVSSAQHFPARVQDPFGLRALPQVHGTLLEALWRLRDVLTVDLNAAAENPFVSIEADDVFHHGNWHHAALSLALDQARLAVLSSAGLVGARVSMLMDPRLTNLAPFLANGPQGSSGVMVLEYTTASALAELRSLAMPVSISSAVLSHGLEEHASFASQAARQTTDIVALFRMALSAELVCAVRALRLQGIEPPGDSLSTAFRWIAERLPAETEDRPLDLDLSAAGELLDQLTTTGEHETVSTTTIGTPTLGTPVIEAPGGSGTTTAA